MIIVNQSKDSIINYDNVKSIWMTVMSKSNRDEDAKFVIVADEVILGEYNTEKIAKEVMIKIAEFNANFNLFKCSCAETQEAISEIIFKNDTKFDIFEMPKE